jgi:hypothetical protein
MSGTESRQHPHDALEHLVDPLHLADRRNALLEAEVEQLTTLLAQASLRAAEWEEAAKGYKASVGVKNEEIRLHWAAWNLMAHDPGVCPEWRRIARQKLGSVDA